MHEVKAPGEYDLWNGDIMFLAGSIEMGTAEDWQSALVKDLAAHDVTVLNPRRDDWNSAWKQSILNPQFKEQVCWELDGLDAASIVVFYFDPTTKSPITLLELGIQIESASRTSSKTVVVCCPDGFWRKGNVEILCERYDVTCDNTYDELVERLHLLLSK